MICIQMQKRFQETIATFPKFKSILERLSDAEIPYVVGGSVSLYVQGNDRKPKDVEDAMRMLRELSGRTHEVLTAVALRTRLGLHAAFSRSSVTFRSIDSGEARRYCDSGEPLDKAGAYAIQGYAAVFIADLKGSYSGVMGLPLFETAQLLGTAGIPGWRHEH